MSPRSLAVRVAPRIALGVVLWAAALGAGACAPDARGTERTVAAAASLAVVATTFVDEWNAARPGSPLRLVLGASSSLVRQLEGGAPYDVLVSASPEWMDEAVARGLVDPSSRRVVARGALVVVAPANRSHAPGAHALAELTQLGRARWTTGDPEHVPLGAYAREALVRAGAWETARETLVAAADARAALRLVERGEVARGVLYAADAASSDAVRVVARVPAALHSPVLYTAAVRAGADRAAWDVLEGLAGDAGRAAFAAGGLAPATADGGAEAGGAASGVQGRAAEAAPGEGAR